MPVKLFYNLKYFTFTVILMFHLACVEIVTIMSAVVYTGINLGRKLYFIGYLQVQ